MLFFFLGGRRVVLLGPSPPSHSGNVKAPVDEGIQTGRGTGSGARGLGLTWPSLLSLEPGFLGQDMEMAIPPCRQSVQRGYEAGGLVPGAQRLFAK